MMGIFLEIKFKGGLGNQLFQYATARRISVEQSVPWLLFNTENYKSDVFGRSFGLINFRTKGSVIRSGLTRKVFQKGTKINRIISSLPLYDEIEEDGLRLQDLPEKLPLLSSISGYWQSEMYFKDIRQLLLQELTPKSLPAFPDWLSAENTVAVHIRRTDYLVENGFGSLKEAYYREAIAMIRRRTDNPVFVFFSDDLDWCRSNFQETGFLFCGDIDWQRDYLQLYLMSRCKHQIIANSSFSWWGAWLNASPSRLVIRPQKPFLDSSLQYESYYPTDWITCKN